jgi:hypothetical protein
LLEVKEEDEELLDQQPEVLITEENLYDDLDNIRPSELGHDNLVTPKNWNDH